METLVKENAYIEGLLVAIDQVAPISQELENDLLVDLHLSLMESRGLFVTAKVNPEEDEEYCNLNVCVITSIVGHYCIPIFTNPEIMVKYMGGRDELRADDPAFAIMDFPQIYEMAMNMPMDLTGIVINPEDQSERIFTFDDMEKVLTEGSDGFLD